MIQIRHGTASDASELSELIFSTAPVLLPYLFGSDKQAKNYIKQACTYDDGQYSAVRHTVAVTDRKVIGCITLWSNSLPCAFYRHTERSLAELLTPQQMLHIAEANRHVADAFSAPTDDQICIGHFAVNPSEQRQGVGKHLLSSALQLANLADKKHLILDVDVNHKDAVDFYIAMGFGRLNETYFKPTQQTFYRMQCPVSSLTNQETLPS